MNEQVTNLDTDVAKTLGLELKPRRFWSAGRVFLTLLVVLALAGGVAFYFWRGTGPTAYLTTDVTRGSLTVAVSATGTLQPQDQVDVGAEISGRVDAVNVDFNDRVRKGQVIAVINTDQIRAQLAQAEASLAANRASVVTAEATVKETLDRRDRARALFNNNGLISAQDLQIAESSYDRAVASVAKARADVDSAAAQIAGFQTQLNKAQVRSPIDGVVLERRVSTGQTVASSFQTPVLFTLASDLATMQLAVDIDEADIGLVREGQTAHFTVDAYPQRQFDARLISVRNLPKTANGVVTYQGLLAVDNSAKLLRPGLTATASILVSETKDVLLVPNGALRFAPPAKDATAPSLVPATNGEPVGRVWMLRDGMPVPRDIRIGHSDGRNTEVISGDLKASDRVITDIAARPARP